MDGERMAASRLNTTTFLLTRECAPSIRLEDRHTASRSLVTLPEKSDMFRLY